MFISKKQYLRRSKDLKLNLLCQQKLLSIEGPQGLITYPLYAEFEYSKIEKKLFLTQTFNDERKKAFFQMYQILLTQSALGVLLGYRRQLNIVGIGYQVSIEEKKSSNFLIFRLGFSHQVNVEVPNYVSVFCPKPRVLLLKGINLQKLHNFAAVLRRLKLPSAYKEKGIYYLDETVSLKQGKKT
ncbi:50S ribosomal protein L6 (mitochondrion) [Nannochloropsis oceanica]|uniref:50S ribosomal protein L6 n=1 Tax=Nannochloropsis oceanica TaxID=145522 RepID=T1R805_9STRA|nr:50S ribosomal protein L6 [Nannochloropsis oceanica]AHX24941.1 50S ribosomal protein L6 [Nannochloropsis oceanica]